jgi:hypothetical protein
VDPENHPDYAVVLEITVTFEPEDYVAALESKLKEYRKRMSLPGFRPGNVPMNLVKARVGKEALSEILMQALNQELGTIYYGSTYLTLTHPVIIQKPDFKILEGNHVYRAWMNIHDDLAFRPPVGESIEVRSPADPSERALDNHLRLLACEHGKSRESDDDPAHPLVYDERFEYWVTASFNVAGNFKSLPDSETDVSADHDEKHPSFSPSEYISALAPYEIPILDIVRQHYKDDLVDVDEEKSGAILHDYLSRRVFEKKTTFFSLQHPTLVKALLSIPALDWRPCKLSEYVPPGPEREAFIQKLEISHKVFEVLEKPELFFIRYAVKIIEPAPIDQQLIAKRIKLSRSVSVEEYREMIKALHVAETEMDTRHYLSEEVYRILLRHNPIRVHHRLMAETLKSLPDIMPEHYAHPQSKDDARQMYSKHLYRVQRRSVQSLFYLWQQQPPEIPDRVARVSLLLALMTNTLNGKNDLSEIDRILRGMNYPVADEPTDDEINRALVFTDGFRRMRDLFTPEEWNYLNVAADSLWAKEENEDLRNNHYAICSDNFVIRRCMELKLIDFKFNTPEN